MSASNSTKAVVIALLGNGFITILKFIGAFFTKSSSMMAEAIHSSADCLNQIFLLIGNKRKRKSTDELHPFGYGREEYFWGFMVAILLFFGGALYSFYEGMHKILHPAPIKNISWALSILGISMIVESKSFLVALKHLRSTTKDSFFKAIKKSIDINLIVILLEDAAALLGLAVAFVCTVIAIEFPIFDGIGSILVGSILVYVSYSLVNELRKMIIGESMPRSQRAKIKEIVSQYDMVEHVNRIKSMNMGSNNYLLLISLNANDYVKVYKVEDTVDEMKNDIKAKFSNISEIYIEISEY